MSEDPIGFAAGDANLYRYVGNAATMWVDPAGLDIYIQTHEVAFDHHHLSILIIPTDQKKWAGHPKFKQLPDGRWYTTIGAGASDPNPLKTDMGYLVNEHHRPTDDKTGRLSDAEIAKDPNRKRHKLEPKKDDTGKPIFDENAAL